MSETLLTLSLIQREDDVLLGYKKRGFGAGLWNGFGGKVQAGESIAAAAGREVLEESGVVVERLAAAGQLRFTFDESGVGPLTVHLFRVTAWRGEPRETAEMRPAWFSKAAIPYDEMWPDDPYWLPLVLRGRSVRGSFHFDAQRGLQKMDVNELAGAEKDWQI